MKITIVGGGNIGTQFAVHCAEKQHEVVVYTSKPELFDRCLQTVDENGKVTHEGEISFATADPCKAYKEAELILVTLPANVMRGCAEEVFQYASSKCIIGVVPGNGGSECAFRKCIERGNLFFLIERVPAIARLVKKGRCVRSTGYRKELRVAALPMAGAEMCGKLIGNLFDMDYVTVPTILSLTMTPSNPILHTTRLRTIFADYREGKTYTEIPLFYEGWNDASSELLLNCDDEIQRICRALPGDVSVKSLREHYESPTAEALTKKLSGIPAFRGITTPTVLTKDGYIPDLHSRYFTADFSFGLKVIQQIARFMKTETPYIDQTMKWYQEIAIEHEEFHYEDYGITDRESFIKFYRQ